MRKGKKWMSFLLTAAMTSALLAGCGSDAAESSGAAETGGEATETEASSTAGTTVDTSSLPELPADGPEINIIVAYSGTSETTSGKSAQNFKTLVEAASGGKITVNNYDNNSLGSETEVMEGVQSGEITMTIVATSPQVTFIPELAVFDLPNALTDLDAGYQVLNEGDFSETIAAAYDNAGFKLLGITPTAFRQMSSNKAIQSIEDFQGIRMRTLENPYHIAYWEALGASPTPVAFSELYMALQQGLVDAQENPLNSIISTGLYEQQQYIIKTNHIMFIYCYVMNKAFFDSLPAEYQAFLEQAMAQVTAQVLDQSKIDEADAETYLKDAGLEIIEVSDELHDQMVEAAQPVYEMIRNDIGDELVDALLEGMEAASGGTGETAQ